MPVGCDVGAHAPSLPDPLPERMHVKTTWQMCSIRSPSFAQRSSNVPFDPVVVPFTSGCVASNGASITGSVVLGPSLSVHVPAPTPAAPPLPPKPPPVPPTPLPPPAPPMPASCMPPAPPPLNAPCPPCPAAPLAPPTPPPVPDVPLSPLPPSISPGTSGAGPPSWLQPNASVALTTQKV